ncbi:hypothetical protein EDEG_02261 [Edhazardia aedis USNM 41457]|uniref:Uncharacterized protein n=1 Tax=Edhazardia aedis (strain USNM 41457) TaxID=1003232 RepID=J9D798_EDHAE|nr:hypothetical protein EDEG_02261 [Edhazardia aedis USNM 41457]|eukprot:EJW03404.1 hypothetical protein EDEG_02261 [Edhazardia aedis USNM 41457]
MFFSFIFIQILNVLAGVPETNKILSKISHTKENPELISHDYANHINESSSNYVYENILLRAKNEIDSILDLLKKEEDLLANKEKNELNEIGSYCINLNIERESVSNYKTSRNKTFEILKDYAHAAFNIIQSPIFLDILNNIKLNLNMSTLAPTLIEMSDLIIKMESSNDNMNMKKVIQFTKDVYNLKIYDENLQNILKNTNSDVDNHHEVIIFYLKIRSTYVDLFRFFKEDAILN